MVHFIMMYKSILVLPLWPLFFLALPSEILRLIGGFRSKLAPLDSVFHVTWNSLRIRLECSLTRLFTFPEVVWQSMRVSLLDKWMHSRSYFNPSPDIGFSRPNQESYKTLIPILRCETIHLCYECLTNSIFPCIPCHLFRFLRIFPSQKSHWTSKIETIVLFALQYEILSWRGNISSDVFVS
jgi:hypothetical protein